MSHFWRQFRRRKPPYVHPKDGEYLKPEALETPAIRSFDDYVRGSQFEPSPNGFQLSLYPSPHLGDLRTAKVIVLLLNPGFNSGDFYAELNNDDAFKRARRNTIAQRLSGAEFKFFLLNPAFCWSPGFQWWEKKLRKTALVICERQKVSYREALRLISSILAAIELVPYHSVSFGKGRWSLRKGCRIDDLPSVQEAIKQLKRRAKDEGVRIYVARQRNRWRVGLKDAKATILKSNNARGVSFSPNSRVGRAILAPVAGLPTR